MAEMAQMDSLVDPSRRFAIGVAVGAVLTAAIVGAWEMRPAAASFTPRIGHEWTLACLGQNGEPRGRLVKVREYGGGAWIMRCVVD